MSGFFPGQSPVPIVIGGHGDVTGRGSLETLRGDLVTLGMLGSPGGTFRSLGKRILRCVLEREIVRAAGQIGI